MIVEQLAKEIFEIIKTDDNIQDKSTEILEEKMFPYYQQDPTRMGEMKDTNCNVFADGENSQNNLTSFGILIVFSTVIASKDEVIDPLGQETNTSLNLGLVIEFIRNVIIDEVETEIGGESGFVFENYHVTNIPQDGEGNVRSLLDMNFTQKNNCL